MPEDDLTSLRLRHKGRSTRPMCAACQKRDTEARIIVQVYEIAKGERGRQIVSKTRSLCASCTGRIFDEIVEVLPDEGAR